MDSQYVKLIKLLTSLKEDYKTTPSTFLYKKIELAEKKLKHIDSVIGRNTTGGGNYKNMDSKRKEFDFLEKLDVYEKRRLNSFIELISESEQMCNYLINNKLPFCIPILKKQPFNIVSPATYNHLILLQMILEGDLILKEK